MENVASSLIQVCKKGELDFLSISKIASTISILVETPSARVNSRKLLPLFLPRSSAKASVLLKNVEIALRTIFSFASYESDFRGNMRCMHCRAMVSAVRWVSPKRNLRAPNHDHALSRPCSAVALFGDTLYTMT